MKDLRTHLLQAQKTIMATAILQNMASDWCEEDVDAAEDEAGTEEEAEDEEDAAQQWEGKGKGLREAWCGRPWCRQDFCLLIL